MPNPEIGRLTKKSSQDVIDAAVSACIGNEVRRGREQDQASAMCLSMARKKTGRALAPKTKRYPTMPGGE